MDGSYGSAVFFATMEGWQVVEPNDFTTTYATYNGDVVARLTFNNQDGYGWVLTDEIPYRERTPFS